MKVVFGWFQNNLLVALNNGNLHVFVMFKGDRNSH